MAVTTCEHFARMCPGISCKCECDACKANFVSVVIKASNKLMREAEKKGNKKK